MQDPSICVGIDIAEKRGCAYYAIDNEGRYVTSGWLTGRATEVVDGVKWLARALSDSYVGGAAIGIDSPRVPLTSPRGWYWGRSAWRERVASEVGRGRHCEVVVAAAKLANPQWTPSLEHAPAWMRLGFLLFEALIDYSHVYEIFPSASYTMLMTDESPLASLVFKGFAPGPKDMLDALVGAVTVREYVSGRGCAIGGGDGLGQIILPRAMTAGVSPSLLTWPTMS
jgi:hypothetical protein